MTIFYFFWLGLFRENTLCWFATSKWLKGSNQFSFGDISFLLNFLKKNILISLQPVQKWASHFANNNADYLKCPSSSLQNSSTLTAVGLGRWEFMNKVSTCTKRNNPHESKYSYHKLKTHTKKHFTKVFFFFFFLKESWRDLFSVSSSHWPEWNQSF